MILYFTSVWQHSRFIYINNLVIFLPFKCHQRQSFLLGTEETFTFTFIEIINFLGYDVIFRNKTVYPQASCINHEYAHKEHVNFPQNMRDLGKAHLISCTSYSWFCVNMVCQCSLVHLTFTVSYLVSLNGHTECSIVMKPPQWPSFIAYCLQQHLTLKAGEITSGGRLTTALPPVCIIRPSLNLKLFLLYKDCHWLLVLFGKRGGKLHFTVQQRHFLTCKNVQWEVLIMHS